uniref:Uncharacterized protein n=1 Tax=Trichuris muris TaxID=70415 RepID=A0A5S6QSJ2_TRIMR
MLDQIGQTAAAKRRSTRLPYADGGSFKLKASGNPLRTTLTAKHTIATKVAAGNVAAAAAVASEPFGAAEPRKLQPKPAHLSAVGVDASLIGQRFVSTFRSDTSRDGQPIELCRQFRLSACQSRSPLLSLLTLRLQVHFEERIVVGFRPPLMQVIRA